MKGKKMGYRWKPSKSKAREFAQKMEEISEYCLEHGIGSSRSMDSFYFSIGGQDYRVSNHTIAQSNRNAYRNGEQIREKYHEDEEREDTVYITASKTRLIEIHQALLAGKKLDRRGRELREA